MMRLINFLISLAMLAAFAWFAVSVPLGKRTLWGHMRAIVTSPEAQDLADGTKQEAEKVAHRVQQELRPPDLAPTAHRVQPPLDPVDDGERQKLKRLVHDKTR